MCSCARSERLKLQAIRYLREFRGNSNCDPGRQQGRVNSSSDGFDKRSVRERVSWRLTILERDEISGRARERIVRVCEAGSCKTSTFVSILNFLFSAAFCVASSIRVANDYTLLCPASRGNKLNQRAEKRNEIVRSESNHFFAFVFPFCCVTRVSVGALFISRSISKHCKAIIA